MSAEILSTFEQLLAAAGTAGDSEPTAMTLATAGADGRISARTVLLKAVDADGFVFYTNQRSLKGKQLDDGPRAALLFHWKPLRNGVQVRIEGNVESVSDAEADAYFASRPRESQIGAWASLQSEVLDSRATFDARCVRFEQDFAAGPVPRPPHWSGYRVRPNRVEFWYGAQFRLHERQQFEWRDGRWREDMLYP